jgi:Flp pilus assembly protein TadG
VLLTTFKRAVSARDEAGQAIVEFAIILPILVFGLLGAADFTRAFAAQLAVQNAARAGAEADALGAASTDSQVVGYVRAELARVPGMDPGDATINIARMTSDGKKFVGVSVRYTFQTTVPWPFIPNIATFDRTTTMRDFK